MSNELGKSSENKLVAIAAQETVELRNLLFFHSDLEDIIEIFGISNTIHGLLYYESYLFARSGMSPGDKRINSDWNILSIKNRHSGG